MYSEGSKGLGGRDMSVMLLAPGNENVLELDRGNGYTT